MTGRVDWPLAGKAIAALGPFAIGAGWLTAAVMALPPVEAGVPAPTPPVAQVTPPLSVATEMPAATTARPTVPAVPVQRAESRRPTSPRVAPPAPATTTSPVVPETRVETTVETTTITVTMTEPAEESSQPPDTGDPNPGGGVPEGGDTDPPAALVVPDGV